eukprot:COSAG01_NODE_18845_length_1049_cov_1.585263_2_plen_98_part_00
MERIAAPIATIETDRRASRSLATPPNAFLPRPSAFSWPCRHPSQLLAPPPSARSAGHGVELLLGQVHARDELVPLRRLEEDGAALRLCVRAMTVFVS